MWLGRLKTKLPFIKLQKEPSANGGFFLLQISLKVGIAKFKLKYFFYKINNELASG